MQKIHKKHIIVMVLAAAGIIIAGAAGFFCWQKFFSPEARMYAAELATSKNHLSPADDKGGSGAARVPILVYHHVGPLHPMATPNLKSFSISEKMFEKHLAYLQTKGYSTISFEQLNNHLKHNANLPKKSVIITFDDAWENQYTYALPLLKKYNFSATFFIPTKNIGHRHILTWDQIKKLDRAGMKIGSHTETHPFLNKITEEEGKKEIIESKKIIEYNLGKTIYDFAYPYGQYNDRVIKMVEDAGYRSARTTDLGVYQKKEIVLNLKGALIFDNLNGLIKILGGI